jgi:hypothetical protein
VNIATCEACDVSGSFARDPAGGCIDSSICSIVTNDSEPRCECDGQFMYDSTVTPPSVTCEGTAVVSNCSYAAKETAGDICLICDDGYSVDPTDQSCIANTCLQEYNCLTCHSDGMKCLTCNAGTIQDPSSGQCYSEKELCEVGRPFFKKQYIETASGICAFEFGCDLTCDRKIQAVCEG